MSEQNNEGLEIFFRKAVPSSKDIEFNEGDWQKLEKKLDEKASKAAAIDTIKRKAWISGASVMALFGLALYFGFSGTFSISNHHQGSGKTASTPIKSSPSDTDIGSFDSLANIAHNQNAEKSTNTKKIVEQKPETAKVRAWQGKESDTKTSHSLTLATPGNQSESHGSNKTEAKIAGDISVKDVDPSFKKNQTIGLVHDNNTATENEPQLNQDSVKASPLIPQPKADSAHTKENKIDHEITVSPSRWSVLLSLSPDFSSSGIGEFTTPGSTVGLQIQYQLSRRWGIGSGVNYSHKRYQSDASDYQMPKGFWHNHSNGVAPYEVDGRCDILDFRIVGVYTLMHRRKNRLTISTGVSAYYFLKESYSYQYDTPNPGAIESWSCKPSKNVLATADFSFSYEHNFSDHIAFGISPYMNVPLQRLGWSKINLYSTGVSLTMRYTFAKKRLTNMIK